MQWSSLENSKRKRLLSDISHLADNIPESSMLQILEVLRSENGVSGKLRKIPGVHGQNLDRLNMLITDFGSDNSSLIMCLEAASFLRSQFSSNETKIDLAYTGPIQFTVPGRSTGSVMKEIIQGAKKNITIIDYVITEDEKDIVEELAKRIESGIKVVIVIDNDKKGKNLDTIERLWTGLKRPEIYTRKKKKGDAYYKIHAKTIVADSKDVFITSANLTWHGINKNFEIGVRVRGKMAESVEMLVRELIETKYLEKVD